MPDCSGRLVAQILHNIIERVSSSTRSRKPISESLAAYFVRATLVNPSFGFTLEEQLSSSEVTRLVELCASRILSKDTEVECAKMQVYFESKFYMQADYLNREKVCRKNSSLKIVKEITEVRSVRTLSEIDAFFRLIVELIVVRSNMGSVEDTNVARQVTLALESVIPHSEIPAFTSLDRSDKEKQLNGIIQLVNGIRIYNTHVNKESTDKVDNRTFYLT